MASANSLTLSTERANVDKKCPSYWDCMDNKVVVCPCAQNSKKQHAQVKEIHTKTFHQGVNNVSAMQLRVLLEHVCNRSIHDVYFAYKPTDDVQQLRLHIWFFDVGGNKFHRSFGPDGRFVELEA